LFRFLFAVRFKLSNFRKLVRSSRASMTHAIAPSAPAPRVECIGQPFPDNANAAASCAPNRASEELLSRFVADFIDVIGPTRADWSVRFPVAIEGKTDFTQALSGGWI
jgi:hypothetical protein